MQAYIYTYIYIYIDPNGKGNLLLIGLPIAYVHHPPLPSLTHSLGDIQLWWARNVYYIYLAHTRLVYLYLAMQCLFYYRKKGYALLAVDPSTPTSQRVQH